ncbi:hypothetical protein CYMTET_45650 [Cymbomonas tetramitiformis]|uniref:Helicase C-terminal domain-containing protein n=1 Tax=Cymbomonas tetramitiformis TaxID=36881 RepID=A0AAE0BXU3_9CHLO|nr:hypothetical protein CYMTET_45650 [Cymbomonas tetramitiformis]
MLTMVARCAAANRIPCLHVTVRGPLSLPAIFRAAEGIGRGMLQWRAAGRSLANHGRSDLEQMLTLFHGPADDPAHPGAEEPGPMEPPCSAPPLSQGASSSHACVAPPTASSPNAALAAGLGGSRVAASTGAAPVGQAPPRQQRGGGRRWPRGGRGRARPIAGINECGGDPPRVLLLPLALGGNGLNLTQAQHVILVEPLLDPGIQSQAVGRVHRIGQTRETAVHHFVVEHTVEEQVTAVCKLRAGSRQFSTRSKGAASQRHTLRLNELRLLINPADTTGVETAAVDCDRATNSEL